MAENGMKLGLTRHFFKKRFFTEYFSTPSDASDELKTS
jgi:hypothetical protein